MAGTYLTAAAALVIAGIVIGVLIVICLGIHREERRGSLTKEIRQPDGPRGPAPQRRWLPGLLPAGRLQDDDDSNYDDDSYDQAA